MSIYDWLLMIIVFAVMMLVTLVGKKEHRVIRFIVITALIPIILIGLHGTCFFDSVPHCLGCVIVPEGEEAVHSPTDANHLKSAGMSGFFYFILIFTPIIVIKDVPKGKKLLVVGGVILYFIFVALPIWAMAYM